MTSWFEKMCCALVLAAYGALPAMTQTPVNYDAAKIRRAMAYLKTIEPETIAEQVRICEIPAPTFQEARRGAYFKQRFTELGLKNVRIDSIGNVIGERPGTKPGAPALALAAHLDTVFPAGTNVKVRQDGTKLFAPGIGDDTRSLAVILAWLRAMDALKIALKEKSTFFFDTNSQLARLMMQPPADGKPPKVQSDARDIPAGESGPKIADK